MKKILLGIAAAFALSTFAVPAFAQDQPAGGEKAEKKETKKAKKGKKGKKAEKKEGEEAAPAK